MLAPSLVQELETERPDLVWVSDITYIRLLRDSAYLVVIMAILTRCVRGWYLGYNLDQYLLMSLLGGIVVTPRTPQGSNFRAAFTDPGGKLLGLWEETDVGWRHFTW